MMAPQEGNPLYWADRPARELVHLAWPIAISMLSVSIMTLTDTLFVGWLGAPALAGVGLGGTAAFVALCFPWGLMSGAKVLVSQSLGAGRRLEAGPFLTAALAFALITGLVITSLGLALGPELAKLAATPSAGEASVSYFMMRIWITPVFLMGIALRETRYGLGDSKSPMIASIVGNGCNILLDYLLIFPAGLGVMGAALATVIAQSIETALLAFTQAKDPMSLRGMRGSHIRSVWQLGWPSGIQWTLEMGAFSTLAVMISMYDEAQMAAHQIVLQVIHFSFLPALALHSATSVLCGQAVGAKRKDLVKKVARRALLIAASYMGMFALTMLLVGTIILRAFSSDPHVLCAAETLLRIAIVFQVFDAANIVARGALQGTGDVRFPAMIGIGLSWISTPPLMWLLGYRYEMGAAGGWLGLCLEIVVGALIFWWRLERDGWHAASQRASQLAHRDASIVPITNS